jgi:hypothetical protein
MPIAKKDDMKDKGRKMMVTTVNTRTVYTVGQRGSSHLFQGSHISLFAGGDGGFAGFSRLPRVRSLLLEVHQGIELSWLV